MADHTQVEVQDIEDGRLVRRRVGQAFSSTLFADAVIAFLDQQARLEEQARSAGESGSNDQPFFAYVPFTAPSRFRASRRPSTASRYYRRNLPLHANFMPQHPFDHGALILRDENLGAWPRTPAVIRDQLAEY